MFSEGATLLRHKRISESVLSFFLVIIMMHDSSDSTSVKPNPAPFTVAVASFANKFCIGTLYALSTLQAQLSD
ncbi:Major facilitator superfamily domain general substrate transporter [Penicillium hordei]|uniref:Major facilitator superfamily domain general substrate transporter n=1 Tax=Penicillium hordei TaxID=40994 RepID=A0AAD6GWY7_9EURO|nr:Major facilitator superfamily domain general substrate transporter [Penicillium hordei]KAJ5592290.1 Major facilitator superfamily domain general substrate transporter [Penicillium hordei]